jgi:hypothetical protein
VSSHFLLGKEMTNGEIVGHEDDTRIVIELSNLAASVTGWLEKAPPARRGRR